MGYILALAQASMLIWSKNVCVWLKATAKDTNNISYTVRYGLGWKAQLVRNLPCMQIFVFWAEASWKLTIMNFLQSPGTHGQNMRPNWLSIYIFRIPLMCIRISDWFTAAHMTYYNFTVRPSKCNITALHSRDIAFLARLLGYLRKPRQNQGSVMILLALLST